MSDGQAPTPTPDHGYWEALVGLKMASTGKKTKQRGGVQSDHLVIALLLDEAGVPDYLSTDVTAIYTGVAAGNIALLKFFSALKVEFQQGVYDKPEPEGLMIVVKHGAKVEPWVLAQGTRILFVHDDPADVQDSMAPEVHESWKLAFNEDVVRAFMSRWYGYTGDGDLRLSEVDYAYMTVDDIILAARRPKPVDFVDRLRRVGDVDRHHDHDDAIPLKDGPVATPPHKKLSEMVGFGDAGTWGITLAQELRAYANGELPWADVDKGILLVGPPGSGKTTFARALAEECGVPLVVSTYSTWEGSGSWQVNKSMEKEFARIRDLAKKNGPLVMFIDEIDSLGARGHNAHNDSYWSAIINCLLAFLDGAIPRDGIVVVAASNHTDRVDEALKRPGRLDRVVTLPAPGIDTLAGMIAHHLDVDPKAANTLLGAKALRGRSPAQVEQACRETRRMGRMLNRKADGLDVADLIAWNRPKRSTKFERLVAVHEAGHLIVGLLRDHAHEVEYVDIDYDNGNAGAVSFVTQRPGVHTRLETQGMLVTKLAGRAAEEVVIGELTSGPYIDLQQCTDLAWRIHFGWGLGDVLTAFVTERVTHDQAVVVEATLKAAYAETLALVRSQRHAITFLADVLIKERYMTGAEVKRVLRDRQRAVFFKPYPLDYEEVDVAIAA